MSQLSSDFSSILFSGKLLLAPSRLCSSRNMAISDVKIFKIFIRRGENIRVMFPTVWLECFSVGLGSFLFLELTCI